MARTAFVWPPTGAVPVGSALLVLPAPPALSVALDALLVGIGPAAAGAAAFGGPRELGAPRMVFGDAKEASYRTAPLLYPGDVLSSFV